VLLLCIATNTGVCVMDNDMIAEAAILSASPVGSELTHAGGGRCRGELPPFQLLLDDLMQNLVRVRRHNISPQGR